MIYHDEWRFPAGTPTGGRLRTLARRMRNSLHRVLNAGAISRFRAALADDESRALVSQLLRYRCLGPGASAIPRNEALHRKIRDFMARSFESVALREKVVMLGEEVRCWKVELDGQALAVPTTRYGLFYVMESDQYFFERDGARVRPEPGDVVLDGGSLLGDTALKFATAVGPRGRVYGLDASPVHCALALETLRTLNPGMADRVEFFPLGLSDADRFEADAVRSPGAWAEAAAKGRAVDPGRRLSTADPRITIDTFCAEKKLDRLDFLKMDIEGSEEAALKGAVGAIGRFRPKLAISIYHRPGDLWRIGNFVRERFPEYRLHVGHHTLHEEETVLYGRREG